MNLVRIGTKRHAFTAARRGGTYALRTACGLWTTDADAVEMGVLAAVSESDLCQNCVRVIGIVGDER